MTLSLLEGEREHESTEPVRTHNGIGVKERFSFSRVLGEGRGANRHLKKMPPAQV
jgi:hypothetical protein